MLVLTRREGEILYVGEDIKIIIIQTKHGSVKIGIEAPKEFKITRDLPPSINPLPEMK